MSQLAVIPGREGECLKKIQWLCDEFDRSKYGQALAEQLAAHSARFLRSEDSSSNAAPESESRSMGLGRVGRSWSVASQDSYKVCYAAVQGATHSPTKGMPLPLQLDIQWKLRKNVRVQQNFG